VLELGTSRQRIEDLARENGRLTAELESARRCHSLVAGQQTPQRAEPTAIPDGPSESAGTVAACGPGRRRRGRGAGEAEMKRCS
jgi:hypothetical protein